MKQAPTVRVWDPLVRIGHWCLVIAYVVAYVTGEDENVGVHLWVGYGIAAWIVIRGLWGFVGGKHAQFRDFVRGPRTTAAYLGRMLRGRSERYLGHNPAGAAMIVALLVLLALCCLTGWLMTTTRFFMAEWLEEIHELSANLLILLIVLHVLGVIAASIMHKENLVRAMITGRKRPEAPPRS